MSSRGRKILAVLLSTSMLFSMTSVAFADDIVEAAVEDRTVAVDDIEDVIETTGDSEALGATEIEAVGGEKVAGWYTEYDQSTKKYSEQAEIDSDGYFNVDPPTNGSEIKLYMTEGAEDLKIRQTSNKASGSLSKMTVIVDSTLTTPVKIVRENDTKHDLSITFSALDADSDIAAVQDRSNIGKLGDLDAHEYQFGRINGDVEKNFTFSGLQDGGDFTYTVGEVDYIEVDDDARITGLRKGSTMPVITGANTFDALGADAKDVFDSKNTKIDSKKYYHKVDGVNVENSVDEDGGYFIGDFDSIYNKDSLDEFVVAETDKGIGILRVEKPNKVKAGINFYDIGNLKKGTVIGVTFSALDDDLEEYSLEDQDTEKRAVKDEVKYVLWGKYTGSMYTDEDLINVTTDKITNDTFSRGWFSDGTDNYSTAYNDAEAILGDKDDYAKFFQVSCNDAWAVGSFSFEDNSKNTDDKVNAFSEMSKKAGYKSDSNNDEPDYAEGYYISIGQNSKSLYISENEVKKAVGFTAEDDLTVRRNEEIGTIKNAVGASTYTQDENFFDGKYDYLSNVYAMSSSYLAGVLTNENGMKPKLSYLNYEFIYDGKTKSESAATTEVGVLTIRVDYNDAVAGDYEKDSIDVEITEDGQNVYAVKVPDITVSKNIAAEDLVDEIVKSASVETSNGSTVIEAGEVSADYVKVTDEDGEELPEYITKSFVANVVYDDDVISANGVANITVDGEDEEPEYIITLSQDEIEVEEGSAVEDVKAEALMNVKVFNEDGEEIGVPDGMELGFYALTVNGVSVNDIDDYDIVSGNVIEYSAGLLSSDGEIISMTDAGMINVVAEETEDEFEVSVNDVTVSQNTSVADFEEAVLRNVSITKNGQVFTGWTDEDFNITDEDGDDITNSDLAVSGNFTIVVTYVPSGDFGTAKVTVTPVEEETGIELNVFDFVVSRNATEEEFLEEAYENVLITKDGEPILWTPDEVSILAADGSSIAEKIALSDNFAVEVEYLPEGIIDYAEVTVVDDYNMTVGDVTVSKNTTSENFLDEVYFKTYIYKNGEVFFGYDASDLTVVPRKGTLAENLSVSGSFVIDVTYAEKDLSASANVIVTDVTTPVVTPSENVTPSANSLGKMVSVNIAGATIMYPESVPYLGQNWKKLLKGTDAVIYALVNGQKVGIKKISIKKGVKPGQATVTAITLANGTKLKKKDINGQISITINAFEITNANAKDTIDGTKAKLNKKNQVKGLKCTFKNEIGITNVKAKKIAPKYTSYDATTKTVSFTGFYKGTSVSGNQISTVLG